MSERVAIVHDWLIAMRGGERVLESLSALYPEADLFTLRYDRSKISATLARHRVTTSFVDRLARTSLLGGRFRGLLPLFPLAAESFRLDGYDLVISSSHCVAAGVLAPPRALHVAYLHSPMRYAWEARAAYEAEVKGGMLGRLAFRGLTHYLRWWDAAASARPDLLIANSTYTQARIRRYYGRDAEVIEPPIDTRRFDPRRSAARALAADVVPPGPTPAAAAATGGGRPLLVVSALVPYKRVELAVRAMQGRPERLIVVGEGPERGRLMALAGPNVTFRGWVGDAELDALYAECRAVVHPAVDDFGMVMVEALAAGKPVVVSSEGGAREIVERDQTGVFFDAPTVEALRAALDRLEARAPHFAPERLRAAARRFDTAVFQQRFVDAVARARVAREVPASGGESANGTRARSQGRSGEVPSMDGDGSPLRTSSIGAVARARRHGKLREVA
jgi:glycosyltransferase involved in cell wall biosynthesis